MDTLLQVSGINSGYDELQILWDVTLDVQKGQRVVILGANGAGKTTLLKAVVGLLPIWSGAIHFEGEPIDKLRIDARIRRGVAYLSELGVIPDLSVEDNLKIGGYHANSRTVKARMEEMYAEFPILRDRKKESGGSLSGGQRKMLAAARALMSDPKLLVMDEPSAGLSPLLVKEVIDIVQRLKDRDMAFVIAEQNIKFLELADKVYVLDSGKIIFTGTVQELEQNDAIRRAYFGVNA